MDMQKILSA